MRRHTRASVPVAFLIANVASLLVLVAAASAEIKYQPAGRFPPVFPDNQSWIPQSFEGLRAHGVAISDKNGHIYVADSARGAVFDYESTTDNLPVRWNGTNTPAGSFGGGHLSVAVDNTSGDVYVADRAHAVVLKFDENGDLITSFGDTAPTADGQLAGSATPDGSFLPPNDYMGTFGITVNQATHDLYVIDARHEVIDVFDEDGVYLRQITDAPTGLYRSGGEYTTSIAVSATSGTVYVADFGGAALVFEFDAAGNYVKTWDGSNTPDGNFNNGCTCNPVSLAVEDSTGNLLVGSSAGGRINVFSSDGTYLRQFRSSHYPGQQLLFLLYGFGLEQSTGVVYVGNWNVVQIFEPVAVPDVDLDPPSNVTTTTATFTGQVAPGGGPDVTECRFEYIDDFEFREGSGDPWQGATSVPCVTSPPYSGPVDVSADASDLVPGTAYHLRLVSANPDGENEVVAPQFAADGEYEFDAFFGTPGQGDGQLAEPQDVAVDEETGDVYVADSGNHRIVKFDAEGDFVSAWGWGVSDGTAGPQVCASGCQAGSPGTGAGQFDNPRYIEVDNSGGPSAHAVYVADTANGTVQKFTAQGALVSEWVDGGRIDLSENGTIAGMTVSSSGDLYAVGEGEHNPWTQLSHDGAFRTEILTGDFSSIGTPSGGGIEIDDFGTYYVTKPQSTSGVYYRSPTNYQDSLRDIYPLSYQQLPSTGLALDRSAGDVFVAQREYIDHFSHVSDCTTSTGLGSVSHKCPPRNTFGFGVLTDASGLAVDRPTGRVIAADPGADRVAVFRRIPLHTVTTEEATGVTATSGTLEGKVDLPPGLAVDECWFEYGTDVTYDLGQVPCTPGGSLLASTPVSATIDGLTPLRTYRFRLAATAANGITRYGKDMSFTATSGLPPDVAGTQVSVDGGTTATVAATVNPRGAATVYRFEYGTSTSYGTQTEISDPIAADDLGHAVSTTLTGLEPGATYHVRVAAFSINGTTTGPDHSFDMPNRPVIVDSGASGVTQTKADLSATIRAGFRPTSYRFEYGPTGAYGSSIGGDAGSGNDPRSVGGTVSGLQPGTTYHFRVSATNAVGTELSADRTFTTAPATAAPPPPRKRCKRGFVRRKGKCVKRRRKAGKRRGRDKPAKRKGSRSHG